MVAGTESLPVIVSQVRGHVTSQIERMSFCVVRKKFCYDLTLVEEREEEMADAVQEMERSGT